MQEKIDMIVVENNQHKNKFKDLESKIAQQLKQIKDQEIKIKERDEQVKSLKLEFDKATK